MTNTIQTVKLGNATIRISQIQAYVYTTPDDEFYQNHREISLYMLAKEKPWIFEYDRFLKEGAISFEQFEIDKHNLIKAVEEYKEGK